MKFNLIIVLIILFFYCHQKKTKNTKPNLKPKEAKKIKGVQNTKIKKIEIEKHKIVFDTINIFPKDTIINSWKLTFKQISSYDFNHLSKNQISTDFKQDDPSDFLKKKDSCYYLTLLTKEKDTLCDFDDGEYHEKYFFKGFSKETNTLIFNWDNWEEAHSILINLNENKHWILCPEYEISPDKKRLVTFSNFIDNPIYEENELFLYELTDSSVNEIYRFSNDLYGIFTTQWIDASTILIEIKKIDFENFKAIKPYFFEINIKNTLQ